MIRIHSPGLGASVQDLGRSGWRAIGVGSAGAMDARALRIANALLSNPETAAGIEFTLGGFEIEAETDCDICLAGPEAQVTVDGQRQPRWWVRTLRRGQRLRAGHARDGMRIYLAVGGGLDLPEVMGARATDLKGGFGGLEGRMLRAGDRLKALRPRLGASELGFGPSPRAFPDLWDAPQTPLRFIPGAEWDDHDADSQALFTGTDWTLSPQSNRIGYRLDGPVMTPRIRRELLSHGILPGTIQLPPSGQPVIQMLDANTAGGYPKLGAVIAADLPRLAQAPLGRALRFAPCSPAEARAAKAEEARMIDTLRRCTAPFREDRP
ncbi:biotin-dependent carboxyltransferase family protein [Pseudooceanicola sp. CBS1P-1]|uniref:5-oxoprolinase/urea amidolyase family protein n=1 Tax=Pseudooceanicola albus TaxID=2692189 RepID=A0A6L7G9L5_9RHOB|nr:MULTISPECIES: biotin-dependent carboxyltransferase family protein [Pseudooceanicola]MBT9386182.1 biotin-dependent carboxyltransferase family protein [Pseudooceanicola endophyticus]MXN19403.1 5-oxoprolinase/urea amidolyase family protein [Pseudooceanicola albus]